MWWITAWWRQLTGPPKTNPWETDPRIKAERAAQHDRIDHVTRLTLRDTWNERNRETWRQDGHRA